MQVVAEPAQHRHVEMVDPLFWAATALTLTGVLALTPLTSTLIDGEGGQPDGLRNR